MFIPLNRISRYGYLALWLLCICLPNLKNALAARVPCERPEPIPHGSYRLKRGGVLMRIKCSPGYTLQGSNFIDCAHGKWDAEKPVCSKKGCLFKPNNPVNGQIRFDQDMKATLFCSDNYNIAGNRISYCNGTHWDRVIGNCRERKNVVEHECDFETEDTCGWVYDQTDNHEWKRVMAANIFGSFRTGPRHDHTTLSASGGHYMLMESLSRVEADVSLISPIYERALSLKTACCFQFFYFMYGAGVGDLYVLVRPMSVAFSEVMANKELYTKYKKFGNQNNLWNEANFTISEMDGDFQIVFVATGGRNHLSDIAIDDVKLMIGNDCKKLLNHELDDSEQSNELEDGVTQNILFDTQSCISRCSESSSAALIRRNGEFFGLCDCHDECEDTDSCCPDFRSVCLKEIFEESSTLEYEDTTAYMKISPLKNTTQQITKTTLTTPTTTTKTTPLKPITLRTTTTTTLTTTTSKKPTTKQVISITTSTKKPTQPTTISTTTTKKPTQPTTISTTTTKTPAPKTTTSTTTTSTSTTTTKKPTTQKPTTKISTTSTTTTTTTPKPTTKKTTTKKSTTSTTTTTTTPKSTTKKTTTTTTTVKPPTITSIETTSTPTTARMTLVSVTPRVKPTRKQQNTTTWVVEHNVNRNSNYHPNFAIFMKYILLCTLAVIIVGSLYCRYKSRVIGWCKARRRNGDNTDSGSRGDMETSSIIAKFSQKFSRNEGDSNDNNSRTQKTRTNKRKPKPSCGSGDLSSLIWEDEGVESDDDDEENNGGITLKRKRSTEL